ncbi:MAG: class I SAM-dependent methyltransferase [Terracidiphilus sp.]|jgi:tRNA (cmo5U34)-methyltransferase
MATNDNATPFLATEYDALMEKTVPFYANFHEEVFHLVHVLQDSPNQWLDTGGGTGTLIMKALPLFPATRFFLADPSAAMLEQARVKLESADPERVSILPAAGSQHLNKELASQFDVITAIQCHHYLDREQRQAAVESCYRLLKPGGLFLNFENIRPGSERTVEIGKEYWKSYQIRKGKSREAAQEHLERFDRAFFPITLREHLSLFQESGFKTADLFWYSYMQAGFFAIK